MMRSMLAVLVAGAIFAGAGIATPERLSPLSSQHAACQDLAEDISFELELATNLASPTVMLVSVDTAREAEEDILSALETLKAELFDRGFRPTILDYDLYKRQIAPLLESQIGAAGEESSDDAAELPYSLFFVALEKSRGTGHIQVRGILPALKPIAVSYVEKDWVSQSPEDLQIIHTGKTSLVGRSNLEGSETDAKRAAVADAADKLRNVVTASVQGRLSRFLDWGGADRLRRHVAEVLPNAIIERSYVQDSYLDQVEKPYGNVHRAHVLLVAELGELKRVAEQAYSLTRRDRNFGFMRILVAFLLAPILFVTYLGLDSATKGYATWALRGGSVLTYAGVLWVLMQSGKFF